MEEYKNKSIKQVIRDIDENKLYLPALQRKFVWGKVQIEMLFDSIMRNYPIGTFLFWKLSKDKANSYVFYEFLKEYDQRQPCNRRKTGSFLHDEITGVLDGQQRLSSIYIGLMGTHTEKAPNKWSTNKDAYRKTCLYLNLLSLPYALSENNIVTREDQNYDFRFLTDDDKEKMVSRTVKSAYNEENDVVQERVEPMFWFKVHDVLSWKDDPEFDVIIDGFIRQCVSDAQKKKIEENKRFIKKCLEILRARINTGKLINYFEINKEDLEDILKIFVRVNSGGTQLTKADLLFSTIVATWDNGRDEIETLIKEINEKGEKFSFTNEYLMRSCLVLSDAPVLYKVNSFKPDNVQKIKDEWKNIAKAIKTTVDLLVEFGFNGSLLTSQNATIIIAYYVMKGGSLTDTTKSEIKKYLIHALLNAVYGGSQDQVISVLRNALRTEKKTELGKSDFSFDALSKIVLPSRKTLFVRESEIDNFLSFKKGPFSFFILSLLYPNLKTMEYSFHQDHIHPYSRFTDDVFVQNKVPQENRTAWLNYRDMVPNLQLMYGQKNAAKNDTEFKKWLNSKYNDEKAKASFCAENYIPDDVDLDFANFEKFFEQRKIILKTELRKVLALNNENPQFAENVAYQDENTENLSVDVDGVE